MESEPVNYFMYLPDELIYLILGDKVLNNTDVLNFGATCKSYHELVLSDPSLWKRKLKNSLKPDVFEVIEQHCDGNWLQQATSYYTLRKTLHTEIANMSPKFFWRQTDITMDDMADVIKYALVNNINYYLCISILSEIVRKEHNIVGWIWIPEKPYRLTDVHYAKIVLRYLFHNYLMIKDAQMQRMNDLAPEKILHFFLQWTDTSMVYEYEEIDNKLTELAEQVLQLLEPTHPARRSDPAARAAWAQHLEDNQWNPQDSGKVLAALAQRLFKERRVSVADGANLETLNITRTIKTGCGHAAAVAIIYSGVARRCGVRIELIAFPHHLYLEYRTTYHPLSTPAYVINLNTGDIGKKQQCPFSSGVNDGDIKYNSKSLLDYLARVFRENMGAIQNCPYSSNSENLVLLSPLLPAGQERGEYRPLAPLVARRIADPARASFVTDDLINLKSVSDAWLQMNESYREIIWMLTNTQQHDNKITRKPVVKQHSQSGLLYCVGMVCYHLQYEYVGVVRGWDARCQAPPMWQVYGLLYCVGMVCYHLQYEYVGVVRGWDARCQAPPMCGLLYCVGMVCYHLQYEYVGVVRGWDARCQAPPMCGLLYCVGMVCYHLQYEYVGVVRGWDARCQAPPMCGLLYCVGMVCYHLQYEYVGVVRGWDARCQAPPMWQTTQRAPVLRGHGVLPPAVRVRGRGPRLGRALPGAAHVAGIVMCSQYSDVPHSGLLYCVGMVCYHLQYEYVGVVRGWDARCQAPPMWQERMRVHELAAGAQQPFYSVLAADYSSRYVAQENLREMAEPTRLYHLEEKLARDFSHFDGFAYVPNEEKESEYPGDAPVREAYRTHLSRVLY
ncbi:uncharacterized protein LOC105391122 [Plutella xylostella]|uniref:uncharacterized protein LOC105391122 n=1 Tax=Plutella xylostella TaxID=51655 RepID=UPI002032BE0B|nr:uncharacterized protein LOC105391122 [Plutella xylostella]